MHGAARGRAVQHELQPVFAPIHAGIFPRALPDAFHKRRRLFGAHRAAGVVIVLLEIQHHQHTRIRATVGRADHVHKMIGLPRRVGPVTEMIRPPQQPRARRKALPARVFSIDGQTRISRFVNRRVDAFPAHLAEVGHHLVVVREVDDGVRAPGGGEGQKDSSQDQVKAAVHGLP